MCTTIVPVYKVEVYYRKLSRVYPVVLSIIFFSSATDGCVDGG